MSLFKVPSRSTAVSETPVLLFRDLKRDSAIKFLWGHQEKILDAYHESHLDTKDLAIELPTGTGKTLVGLLVGEFRRRSRSERVVFLCSTKQLCAQVHRQARQYGIPTSLLIGRQSEYDSSDFFNYQQSKALGITTYSGLFNTNPRINDSHVIICDDAHAAENFIPEMWTVRVSRHSHSKLFDRLYSLLKGVMTDNAAYRIEIDDRPGASVVDLISPIALDDLRTRIAEAIGAFLEEYTDLSYPWSLINCQLRACNLYCSSDAFEFRPVLAPTLTHTPFAGARQRIYMSATLGEDGDLERCFGVKRVCRLPVPEGWDNRGTGRRLTLFPELSPMAGDGLDVLNGLLGMAKRTLILVPNNRLRQVFHDTLKDQMTVFVGAESEDNIEKFRRHPGPAVLILANRYDGIDFPGDECRSLVVYGFPIGAGLQETFLTQRLKASSIIRDRIRTRVTQAMGRCTRDESDYSIVLVFDSDLVKWFCTAENLAGMHPELQAEVAFGLENSTDRDTPTFLKLSQAFLDRSSDWDAAEDYIKSERARKRKTADPGAKALQKAAELEIEFTYALWNGRYEEAYHLADAVLGCLSGGEEMRAYRCFWQHEAAVAAFLTWKQSDNESFRHHAVEHLKNATKGNYGITWLVSLAAKLSGETPIASSTFSAHEWFSSIEQLLSEVALTGSKFDRILAEKREFICSTEAKKFHQGLTYLGRMLGARTYEWDGSAKPDGFWNLAYSKGFVFEAKTGEFGHGSISISTVRQALTHEKCAREDRLLPDFIDCYTIVISSRNTIEAEARLHAGELRCCSHSEVVELFDKAATALTELRVIAPTHDQDLLPSKAMKIYEKYQLLADDIVMFLTGKKLSQMSTSSEQTAAI